MSEVKQLEQYFSLSAPHYSVGVYMQTDDEGVSLAALSARLQVRQHARPLAAKVAVSQTFPRFGGLAFGIQEPVELIPIADFSDPFPHNRHLIEGSLQSPSVGRVLTSVETIEPEVVGIFVHPLCVTISADLLDASQNVPLSADELHQAGVEAKFLVDTLKDLTEFFDPVYGVIVAEEPIPTPADLANGELRSGDIFINNKLLAADELLESELSAGFRDGHFEKWRRGNYYSNWAPMNSAGRSTTSPIYRGSPTAQALRRAFDSLK